MYHLKIRIMKKAVDYLNDFSLTNEPVSIEELHSFVQMQKLVSNYPIPFFTDGYYFFVDEVCDEKMYYADIAWAETVKTNQSLIHMKDGKSFALPISALGTRRFLSNSKMPWFVQINISTFVSLAFIEMVSKQAVCLKECDKIFKISKAYFKPFYNSLQEFLNNKQ